MLCSSPFPFAAQFREARQALGNRGLSPAIGRAIENAPSHFLGEVILAGKAALSLMVIGIAGAIANFLHQLRGRIQYVLGRHQAAGFPRGGSFTSCIRSRD